MPLALSATSSSYFVDRDLPLARSLFLSCFRGAKVGSDTYQRDGTSDWVSRKDQRAIEIYGGTTRLSHLYLYIPNMSYLVADIYDRTKSTSER